MTVCDGRVAEVVPTPHALWADGVAVDAEVVALVASLRAPYRVRPEEVLTTATVPVPRADG